MVDKPHMVIFLQNQATNKKLPKKITSQYEFVVYSIVFLQEQLS